MTSPCVMAAMVRSVPCVTPGAARHLQRKDALQQPCPAPARRSRIGLPSSTPC